MISSKRIEEIFLDCFFKQEELIDGKPSIEPNFQVGIVVSVNFHPKRVEKHKEEIESILKELPKEFEKGMSFLNLSMDKDGEMWTSSHLNVEQLLILGLAIGKLKYLIKKEMWNILPGGMPYIILENN